MMIFKMPLIILMALFILSCSGQPENGTVAQKTAPAESGPAAQQSVISIHPLNASANSVITLHVSDRNIQTSSIRWFVNGQEDNSQRSVRFSSVNIKKGDVVKAVLNDRGTDHISNEIYILNSAPAINRARLLPEYPVESARLTLDISAADIDDDYIFFKYKWSLNGQFAGEGKFLQTDFKRGDVISVEVTPNDRAVDGTTITLKTTIVNSLPVVSAGSHKYDGSVYTYNISASDPDGDLLTYKIEEGQDGMSIDPASGLISWKVGPAQAGIYELKVSVSDNHGGKLLIPITTVVGTK
jgi:hypothetical protein